jgi:hypothetical protein
MIDVQPTMNDNQVMDFVLTGYVVVEGVVSSEFNRQCQTIPGGSINEFARSPEFLEEVLLHPEVAGVARSLLGPNFLVPTTAHHHLFEAPHTGQTWHSDGLSEYGYGVYHLQCYYYPQEVRLADGPTMVLPGSHYRLVDREAIAHYGNIVGQVSLTVPAGTVALTHYGIWHKAGPKLNAQRRGMIKFSYFRNCPPKRDWVTPSDEVPPYVNRGRHPYATEVEFYRDMSRCKRTWDWLCGVEAAADVSHGAKLFIQARPLGETDR